jgi:hypothetical protein
MIANAARPYLQCPLSVLFGILESIFGYATPVFSSRSSSSSRSGCVGGQMAYVIGVRADAMNCIQKSGGQPSLVTKKTSLSCAFARAAVSHKFGMLTGLKARAKLRATPARQATTKIAWTMAWWEKRVTRSLRSNGARSRASRSWKSLEMLPEALKPTVSPPRAFGRTKERMKARK